MSDVQLAIFSSVLLSVPRLNAQAADNGEFLAGGLSRQGHFLADGGFGLGELKGRVVVFLSGLPWAILPVRGPVPCPGRSWTGCGAFICVRLPAAGSVW
jgi:hypothetical protein